MTISGIAHRTKDPGIKTEHINFSINQISFDRDDIQNISALVDMEQVNNACFNFVAGIFTEENRVEKELHQHDQLFQPYQPAPICNPHDNSLSNFKISLMSNQSCHHEQHS